MEKQDHEFCLRCGRKLKNPIAREKGYGAVCEKKMAAEHAARLFDTGEKTKMMKTYVIMYSWQEAQLREEVPADSPQIAEKLFLQKMQGNYSIDELTGAGFRVISVEPV